MANFFTESLINIGSASAIIGGTAANKAMNMGKRTRNAYQLGSTGKGGFAGGMANVARGINNNMGATGYGAMAGAGYGAMADDTSMVGGAFMGAGMGYAGRKLKNSMF